MVWGAIHRGSSSGLGDQNGNAVNDNNVGAIIHHTTVLLCYEQAPRAFWKSQNR